VLTAIVISSALLIGLADDSMFNNVHTRTLLHAKYGIATRLEQLTHEIDTRYARLVHFARGLREVCVRAETDAIRDDAMANFARCKRSLRTSGISEDAAPSAQPDLFFAARSFLASVFAFPPPARLPSPPSYARRESPSSFLPRASCRAY